MKRLAVVLTICFLTLASLPLSGQQAPGALVRSVYGRLDSRLGRTPSLDPPDNAGTEELLPPLTTYTGKFVVNFTITISSAVPTGDTIACDVDVIVIDAAGDLTDDLSVAATRSGSTATCSVTLPYSWAVTSASDTVYVAYDVSAPPQPLVSSSTFPRRYSAHPIAKITVPATGATTTYTVTPTI
jgi:hypothetical protein